MADLPATPANPTGPQLPNRRRSPAATPPGRAFLAWPAAASLVTLVSVACLMAGAWGVLAPTLGDPEAIGSRLAVLGILAAYLGALGGTVWLFCHWQRGNHDAIGAAVSAAALAVGWGVTLDLVAPDRPWIAAACAGAGLVGLGALVRLWRRAAPLVAAAELGLPVALLLGWNLVWPVLLGVEAARDHARLAPAGVVIGLHPATLHPATLWLPGWLIGLAAALLLLWRAVRGPDPWAGRDEPFLLRPAMRWALALVMLLCSVLHQYMLGYTAGLDFLWGDFLAPIALLLLIGNELRARAIGADGRRDLLAMVTPAGLALIAVLAGQALPGTGDGDELVRGPGWVRVAQSNLLSPAAIAALVAAIGAWLGWRRQATGLTLGAGVALLTAVLVWDVAPESSRSSVDLVDLHWTAAAMVGGLLLVGAAIALRRPGLALAAVVGAEAFFINRAEVHQLLTHADLSPAVVVVGAAALTVLAAAALWPRLIGRAWLHTMAWLGMAAVIHCCWREQAATYAPILFSLRFAAKLAFTAWRCRDPWLLAPLAVPAAAGSPWLMPENKAWLAIAAAFLLLGAALVIGWRRVRTRTSTPGGPLPLVTAPAGPA